MNRAGLKRVRKTVRGKRGSVQRTYWVKANPAKPGTRKLRGDNKAPRPGFLQRHAGKIAAVAGLAGAAYTASKVARGHWGGNTAVAGAIRGASLANSAHSGSGSKLSERAKDMFRMARAGYASNRAQQTPGRMGKALTDWRRGVGSDLAQHLAESGGHAAAGHIGSRVGGMVGGLLGPVGSFFGSQAGGFLASRYGGKHITRGAQRIAEYLRR